MDFIVNEAWSGRLLRDYLRTECEVSRKTLVKLKAIENGIMLNGEPVTVRSVLKLGDKVEIAVEDSVLDENPNVVPVGAMPKIIYEDEAVIAVNKPAGMPTHTSFGHYEDSLSNAVCLYMKSKGLPFVFRAVNRLDCDTSGVVLIAKNRHYAAILSKSLQNGEFKKKYIAIVNGKAPEYGEIEGYIAREGESIIKRCLYSTSVERSDYSLTKYVSELSSETASVLFVTPITGRTHQIRVHMSSIGHPIIGDTLYGEKSDHIDRQALHAYSLSFPSPINGEEICVIAPLADDMKALVKSYFGKEI